MLQDDDMLVNQPVIQQHNLQQHNIVCNRRHDQLQVTSPNRTDVDPPMMEPPQGPQIEPQGPEQVLYYQHNTLIQQVVNLDVDSELQNLIQGNDASIEEKVNEIIHELRTYVPSAH